MQEFKGFMNSEGRIEELRIERSLWMALTKEKRMPRTHEFASKMAKADRSDPFVYDRIYSSLSGNFTTPDDYRNQITKR